MEQQTQLLKKLIERQVTLGLADGAFAKELRVSRSLWCRTKAGEVPIGIKLASGITHKFPDLIPDILIFLGTDSTIRNRKLRIVKQSPRN